MPGWLWDMFAWSGILAWTVLVIGVLGYWLLSQIREVP